MSHILWTTGHELQIDNMVTAYNCELTDSKGKKHIDMESGVWCTSLGHAHPRVNRAIRRQLEQISHSGFCY